MVILIATVINKSPVKGRPDIERTALRIVVIPYIKGISEEFRCIENRYISTRKWDRIWIFKI
jgi:hypothetical protein